MLYVLPRTRFTDRTESAVHTTSLKEGDRDTVEGSENGGGGGGVVSLTVHPFSISARETHT